MTVQENRADVFGRLCPIREPLAGAAPKWLVPGAEHIESFHLMGQVYVDRVVSFFNETLGPPVCKCDNSAS